MKFATRSIEPSIKTKSDNFTALIWSYFGAGGTLHEGPQAYLSDMPEAGSNIPVHFHDVDQFQVFVRGGGKFGPTPIGPISFHYSDAYTPYGPIAAAEEGVTFFTLRAACAGGHFVMPKYRNMVTGKVGRSLQGKFEPGTGIPAQGLSGEVLLSSAENLKVVSWGIGRNCEMSTEASDGGQQYYLVCAGSVSCDGRVLPPLSLIHKDPGETPITLHAGPEGAQVLLLQFPFPTNRPWATVRSLKERGLANNYEKPGHFKIKANEAQNS